MAIYNLKNIKTGVSNGERNLATKTHKNINYECPERD
jgi:hypothetical protein